MRELKVGLSQMLKKGVIMDVVNAEQAKIAEDAGAIAVMALERVPADLRRSHQVARMSAPELIQEVMDAVDIPVMAKCRIGHFVEAQLLEALGVDFIDESEVLTPADSERHIDKARFATPFVCGATDLGQALRRIAEGAALIRTKGEAGTGNIVEAVRHLRRLRQELAQTSALEGDALEQAAKRMGVPAELVEQCGQERKLPVPSFAAGGIATPGDAALAMQLGAQSVFVGSGVFKSEHPEAYARAIVTAVAHFDEPKRVLEASRGLSAPMAGLSMEAIEPGNRFAERGV